MDVAMAPPTALTWPDPVDAAELESAWPELPATSAGVPLRTRFSRLAL
jgi:hypothetical protein